MQNYDTLLVIFIPFFIITGWLPTYVIMRRKLISERNGTRRALREMDDAAFALGVEAGRDEKRRAALDIELAQRRANFPYKN